MMEPEYMRWCKENMPENLFTEMVECRAWDIEWRSRKIKKLENWQLRAVEKLKLAIFGAIFIGEKQEYYCIACGKIGCHDVDCEFGKLITEVEKVVGGVNENKNNPTD